MSPRYTTITYSGLALDAFMTDDQQSWLTLSSLATGLGVHRQTVANWLKHQCKSEPEHIDVKVGKFNKAAKAYPVEIAVDFLKHLASKGNKEADALLTASVVTDIQRSIKESNGILITAEQHEEVRYATRLAYLEQWVSENYKPVRAKDGTINVLKGDTIRAAGLDKNPTEYTIVNLMAQVAKRELWMETARLSKEELEMYQKGNQQNRQDIQKLSLSLA